ncbi:hypothetical protein CALCODRAFT_481905 [Calocera cornea HHB12733]|uniref:Uncharacterized protein n=1 Tax=Calocera cornea HHB12733 TaxID=1353952 RepID=A0A165H898_9BASI|nr:hypothetical protein CALCODRAFT_481905 [Calocera cornea HHB12733]
MPTLSQLGTTHSDYFVTSLCYLAVRYALANPPDFEDSTTPEPSLPSNTTNRSSTASHNTPIASGVAVFDYQDFYYTLVSWFLDNWDDQSVKGVKQYWASRLPLTN